MEQKGGNTKLYLSDFGLSGVKVEGGIFKLGSDAHISLGGKEGTIISGSLDTTNWKVHGGDDGK